MAARAPSRVACRRTGTHRHGVVAGSRQDTRLLPCRGQGWSSLLGLPRRHLWPRDSRSPLVHARAVCMKEVRDKRAPKPVPEVETPLRVLENQPPYAEIAVTTNFSFLRGASSPKELVLTSACYAYHAIGIADRNTLAGVVRA